MSHPRKLYHRANKWATNEGSGFLLVVDLYTATVTVQSIATEFRKKASDVSKRYMTLGYLWPSLSPPSTASPPLSALYRPFHHCLPRADH